MSKKQYFLAFDYYDTNPTTLNKYLWGIYAIDPNNLNLLEFCHECVRQYTNIEDTTGIEISIKAFNPM